MSQAVRSNVNKLRWDLMDWKSLEEVVKVLEFGANKYAPKNWEKGLHREEILESIQRHNVELFSKEEVDEDSQLLHAAHIACNAIFYIHFLRNKSFSPTRNNPFTQKEKPRSGLAIEEIIQEIKNQHK